MTFKVVFLLGIAALSPAVAMAQTTAAARPAQAASAGKFVDDLTSRAFAILREEGSQATVRTKFRTILRENFAIEQAGNRLIRRYRSQITPAQLASYQAALPEYIINLYADRLYDYTDAKVRVVRTVPHGAAGGVDVYSRVETPKRSPFDVIWAVENSPGSKFLISNVTVSGVNLALTQEADFSSYIAKNGFDALVNFMKSANARPVA